MNSLGLQSNFAKDLSYFKDEFNNGCFVFPSLKVLYTNFNEFSEADMDSFVKYKNVTDSFEIIYINCESGAGKTALSAKLFRDYFVSGFSPVVVCGKDIKDRKNLGKIINLALGEQYLSQNITDIFEQSDRNKKILIIDDYNEVMNSIIETVQNQYCKIICIGEFDNAFLASKVKSNMQKSISLKMMPFYKYKRKELLKQYYANFVAGKENIGFSVDDFVLAVENAIGKVDKFEMLTSSDIIFVASKCAENISFTYDSESFSSFFEAKQLLCIGTVIKFLNIDVDCKPIQRILGLIAWEMYKRSQMFCTIEELKNYLRNEKDVYGTKIDPKTFIKVCCDSKQIYLNDEENIVFHSRSIFSFYIAYYCIIRPEKKISEINDLINSDFYIPLNFSILMNLCLLLKNSAIVENIIEKIGLEIKNQKVLICNNDFDNKTIVEEVQKLKSLTQNDIDNIDKRIARNEAKAMNNYNKNRDNYFYYEKYSEELSDLMSWHNKLKVCCVLLQKFSSSLVLEYKQKLIAAILDLPLLIISKYNDYIFKVLDEQFVSLENSGKITNDELDEFAKILYDIKRAVSLTILDSGARCFNNSTNIKLLNIKEKQNLTEQILFFSLHDYLSQSNINNYSITQIFQYIQEVIKPNKIILYFFWFFVCRY